MYLYRCSGRILKDRYFKTQQIKVKLSSRLDTSRGKLKKYSMSFCNSCELNLQGELLHSSFENSYLDLMLWDMVLYCIASSCLSRNREPRRKVKKRRDKDADLRVKTNGVNNVKRQVSISFFCHSSPALCDFFCLSLFLSLSTDEIANDL